MANVFLKIDDIKN